MAIDRKMLAAGGILAVSLTIGLQIDTTERPVPEPAAVRIARAAKGEEIRSLREPNREVFKADSAWVHPKGPDGKAVKADSFKVAAFTARVYARPKYFRDAGGDTLRPLDLTVREISALAKINPFKTHDRYVDAGPYTAQWMNNQPGNFRIDAGAAYVKYRALFAAKGATVSVQATADGMKETVTLADSTAAHVLRWVVETDGSLAANACGGFDVRAKDGSVPMRIQRPVAWDAGGKPVMASATVEGDTLTFRVTVLPGQEYPVTVDPTTSVKADSTAAQLYSLATVGDGYAAARNKTTANSSDTGALRIGQTLDVGSFYTVRRGFLCFPGIPEMFSASACTLFLKGSGSSYKNGVEYYLHSAAVSKPAIATDDFNRFDGWRSSGAYNGAILNNSWTYANYAGDEQWSAIVFAPAGIDTLKAAKNDSLWLAILSKKDHDSSAPTGYEYMEFYTASTAGKEPYVSFTYVPTWPGAPTNYVLHTPSATGMKASWTNNHSSDADSLRRFTGAGAWAKTLAKTDTSETITGLSPNTRYIYKARVDSGGTFGYSNADTLYTLANPPNAWNFTEDYDDSTKVNIGFGTNGNPSGTVYAIRDSTNRKWISAAGDTAGTAAWRTAAEWAALGKLVNRTAAYKQRFGVAARNGDGVETSRVWGSLSIGNVRRAEIAATEPLTHGGRSAVYSNQRGTESADSIVTAAFDTLGQRLSDGAYQTWRASVRFAIPAMDDAVACSLRTTGAGDHSATDFGVMAAKGLWTGGDPDVRYHDFSGWSSGLFSTANMLQVFSTSSYTATMKWPFSATGLSWLYQARGDTLRMNVFSSRDSSATAPPGDEFIRIANPALILRYAKTELPPSNAVATAISADSLLVTWTDNSATETGFALVDALTGMRMGGNDSTAANTMVKRMGGLDPNTEYTIAVMALGGKADGDVSTAASPCFTPANTPGMPSAGFPARGRISFTLDPGGNPSWTLFAVQDSATGLFVDASAEPETLRAGPPGEWGWRTYGGWGSAGGDTLAGVRPGGFHVIRVKARNGR